MIEHDHEVVRIAVAATALAETANAAVVAFDSVAVHITRTREDR
jgi:hypothetical protein